MNEKQFRFAVQANTKCGKRFLNAYCKNHSLEYTDEEYNSIIRDYNKYYNMRRGNKPILVVNNTASKLTSVLKSGKPGRKRKNNGDDV